MAKSFIKKVPKLNPKTMVLANKLLKLTTSNGKAICLQEQGDIAFQFLVKSQSIPHPLSLTKLMAYQLGYVCQSLDIPDGLMAKTNKATLVHHLSNEHVCFHSMNKEALYIEDGNATYYCIKDIPENFKLTCLKMFDENCPHKGNVVFLE